MLVEDKKLSLTAMAKNFAEKDVSREMLLQTLIQNGFMNDIKTITSKGEANGISYHEDERGKWPVYDRSIQERLADNIPYMLQHFPNLRVSVQAPAQNAQSSTPKASSADKSFKYPYLRLNDFVILDTETTGLSENDEIIELSVVSNTGEELYHSYYCPQKEVDPGAQKVNHLSKEKLKDCPAFSADEWNKILAAIDGKPVMGHNIPFDMRLINQTLKKSGVPGATESAIKTLIDTKVVAKKHIQSSSYSLNNLTTLIGITKEEQHNATDDCRMTLEFINRLEDILQIRNDYNFIK